MSALKPKEPPYLPMPLGTTPLQLMIEVEQRVEHEEIASDSFATVHGVIGEQNHVPLCQRYVNDRGSLRHVAAIEKP